MSARTPRPAAGQGHALVAAQGPANQTIYQLATLAEVQHENRRLYRAFLLREELPAALPPRRSQPRPEHLDAWLAWATRSRLPPFVRLARTLREHREGILAAIRLGLSNGRLEGLNSKIRPISHRSFGFHTADALIALVYLCCTHRYRPAPMNFTHKRTGAPYMSQARCYSRVAASR